MALGLRLVSSAVAFLATVTFPAFADQHFSVFREPNAFWDGFARYDAGWYYDIAAHGYAYVEGGRNNLAFFPLYPLLMRGGGYLLGGEQQHFYFAGILVSFYDAFNACIATATLCTVPLVWRRFGVGYAAVIVLGLALPLSSGQSEGLGRYSSVLFPVPLLLGSFGGEARHMVLMTGSAMLYALGLALFVNVHPLF
jgi:hypothetical protein